MKIPCFIFSGKFVIQKIEGLLIDIIQFKIHHPNSQIKIMDFNFKQYHMRSINAASAEERAAINQELKDFYASLNEEDKKTFNTQLQTFIAREMGRLKTDYEAIKQGTQN